MKKIFAAVALVSAVILGSAVPASAAGARMDHLPGNYCDSGSAGWQGWQWPSNGSSWGASNICGLPSHGDYKVASWDGSADGRCAEIWRSGTLTNSTWSPVPNTRACGTDVIKISSWQTVTTRRLMIVLSNVDGSWVTTTQIYYQ